MNYGNYKAERKIQKQPCRSVMFSFPWNRPDRYTSSLPAATSNSRTPGKTWYDIV